MSIIAFKFFGKKNLREGEHFDHHEAINNCGHQHRWVSKSEWKKQTCDVNLSLPSPSPQVSLEGDCGWDDGVAAQPQRRASPQPRRQREGRADQADEADGGVSTNQINDWGSPTAPVDVSSLVRSN